MHISEHAAPHEPLHHTHSLLLSRSQSGRSQSQSRSRSSCKRARECTWTEVFSNLEGLREPSQFQEQFEKGCSPQVFLSLSESFRKAVVTECGMEGWADRLCSAIKEVRGSVHHSLGAHGVQVSLLVGWLLLCGGGVLVSTCTGYVHWLPMLVQ